MPLLEKRLLHDTMGYTSVNHIIITKEMLKSMVYIANGYKICMEFCKRTS
jgi:hypothetical protein